MRHAARRCAPSPREATPRAGRSVAAPPAIIALLVLALVAGCGAAKEEPPADGSDATSIDAGAQDSGALDVGSVDASGGDASDGDAAAPDSSNGDAGKPDASKPDTAYAYPPANGPWETISAADAGFDAAKLQAAVSYIGSQNSTALMIVHRGRVVVEQYWQGWSKDTSEPMFSATKSVTSALIGLAASEGLLSLDDTVSKLLGTGWSGATKAQEAKITVRQLLNMTSGLTDTKGLTYVAPAGTQWDYNTKAYYKLGDILEKVTGSRTAYTQKKLWGPIGMTRSAWVNLFFGTVKTMKSSARDMARFGLLVLSKGAWAGKVVVPAAYLAEATQTSQQLNPSYGLLFWLNGKSGYMLPKKALKSGSMIPAAPKDMVAALGAKDKKIYIVPSLDLVVVRHGGAAKEGGLAGSSFDNELWKRLSGALKK